MLLEKLLNMIQVHGTVYFLKNYEHNAGVEIPEQSDLCRFHLVLEGKTKLLLPDSGQTLELIKGDFIVVPNGKRHVLSSDPESATLVREPLPDTSQLLEPVFDRSQVAEHGLRLLCGYARLSSYTPQIIPGMLPNVLTINTQAKSRHLPLDSITKVIEHELSANGSGSSAILSRLTDVIFMCALRDWINQNASGPTNLSLIFSDEKLHRALTAIHEDPAMNWTVEKLARLAGQSRSAFSANFSNAMAMTPINYLLRYRMALAQRLLRETRISLAEVAARIGYVDPSAFNRAFQRVTGTTPHAYRKSSAS